MEHAMNRQTTQALASITDEGLFECIATDVLREDNSLYRLMVQTGVNADGKTVKAPVDGICFVPYANPPHMIAVHHTITSRKNLKDKWLYNPSNGTSRRLSPSGDLIKTAEVAANERQRTPNLAVTLVLTTNQEPNEALIRDVNFMGEKYEIEIDIWSCSRLSHFLDSPHGQWLRRKYLGIEQEELSIELLKELSQKSLGIQLKNMLDNDKAWIPRSFDDGLTSSLYRDVTFLLAGSGLGKSVACYRMLKKHVEGGGFGIVLSHKTIDSAMTLEEAVTMTLRQLHPALSETGISALSFCSADQPLLLMVEDINRSNVPKSLAEKIAGWSSLSSNDKKTGHSNWHIVCPLWPEVFAILEDQAQNRIAPLIFHAEGFTESEGRDAVLTRAQLDGHTLTPLNADEISFSLGHDPLLIAIHNYGTVPDPHQTIRQFVENALHRAAEATRDHPATDYRQALRSLAGEMLSNRKIELDWNMIRDWKNLQSNHLTLLSRLAHLGDLISFTGPSDNQHILFRHDRVRDWILADSAADLARRNLLAEEVIAEPYFAEIMGAVLILDQSNTNFLQRIITLNPLALFHAFRLISPSMGAFHDAILQAINHWLEDPTTHERANFHLRWEALTILAQTDSPMVPTLVAKFYRNRDFNGILARLRNGDIGGGIELCTIMDPGITAPWRDIQIEHAKLRFAPKIVQSLGDFLMRTDLSKEQRIGALRLAGHIADPHLALAIEASWTADNERGSHLREYLWAFGECCGDDPEKYLGPVCDAWAALPDQTGPNNLPSPRDSIAPYELRWAFHKWPPKAAIDYFIQRGSNDELKRQITFMLHEMDHPKAVLFVVQELAIIRRRIEGTSSFSHLVMSAPMDWKRKQEQGHPMSPLSRDILLGLWQGRANDKHLRTQAFLLWAATQYPADINILGSVNPSDELSDDILRARLIRGDQQAIPWLIEKLSEDDRGFWWQYGRYLWSPELTKALDEYLTRRGTLREWTWEMSLESDWVTHEMLMRLPQSEAERLLLKHWDHLRFSNHFVQTTLYVSTPALKKAAEDAITECPDPAKLLENLGFNFGIRTTGHPGITREAQVLALAPYLNLLNPFDIWQLWTTCNDHRWFTLRQDLLDARLQKQYLKWRWDHDQAISELDETSKRQPIGIDINFWIDNYLKTGVTWNDILSTMTGWLGERQSFEALQLVAAALRYIGTRDNLEVLRIYEEMPETESRQLIADTQFVVHRRTIQ